MIHPRTGMCRVTSLSFQLGLHCWKLCGTNIEVDTEPSSEPIGYSRTSSTKMATAASCRSWAAAGGSQGEEDICVLPLSECRSDILAM